MTVFAMIFPGQGSQKIGMLSELAANYSLIKKTFDEASDVLNYDLWKLIQLGPFKELNKIWKVQPALLTASVAIWRVWRQQGGEIPKIMAGHSLGEYSALVCAGSLDFATAITLTVLRGKLMQEAAPPGTTAMSAIIGLDKKTIELICAEVSKGQIITLVNFNSPNQIVIGGHKKAVERANYACKNAGAKYIIPLSVNVASHCILMQPAAIKLSIALKKIKFSTPCVPIINNVDVRIEKDPKNIRQALIRQLYNPVRWTEIIEHLVAQKIEFMLEIGPKSILTDLNKHFVNTIPGIAVNDPASLNIALCY